MRIPNMDGLALLKKVKEINPNVRTMLISAYAFENIPNFEKYLQQGIINSCIENPVKINRHCQRVRDEIDAYKKASKI